MGRSLHEQGHTVPFFNIIPPKYNHRFLVRKRSRCRFRVHSTRCTCGCSSFWILAMLCRWLLYDTFREPVLLCKLLVHFLFLPSTATMTTTNFTSASGQGLSRLSSSGSASASRAPQTLAAEANGLCVYCHDDGAFLLCCAIQIGVGTLVEHIDPDVSS